MKTKTKAKKSNKQSSGDRGTARDTGGSGVAAAPPAYGVSSVDSQPVQAQQSKRLEPESQPMITPPNAPLEKMADKLAGHVGEMQEAARALGLDIGEKVIQNKLVQRHGNGQPSAGDVHEAAARGIAEPGSSLPHLDVIQRAFGGHDVSGVKAHVGGAAAAASAAIGADAYATGNDVAFQSAPDLHTAAHEAAHVVQQRAGVQLSDNVGQAGDAYERHADAVADEVVAGRSAESLLDSMK